MLRHLIIIIIIIIINVARIFTGRCTFFLEKVDDLLLVATVKTQAKTTKLTAPTLQISPAHQKSAPKFVRLLCLGCTYNFPL